MFSVPIVPLPLQGWGHTTLRLSLLTIEHGHNCSSSSVCLLVLLACKVVDCSIIFAIVHLPYVLGSYNIRIIVLFVLLLIWRSFVKFNLCFHVFHGLRGLFTKRAKLVKVIVNICVIKGLL